TLSIGRPHKRSKSAFPSANSAPRPRPASLPRHHTKRPTNGKPGSGRSFRRTLPITPSSTAPARQSHAHLQAAVQSSGQPWTSKSLPATAELLVGGRPSRLAHHGTPLMSTPLFIAGAAASGFAVGFVPALADSLGGPLRQQLKGADKW